MDDFDEWKIKNSCEIARVVIKPEYQNGRISYYLLDSIIQIVKNRGYDGIHISVQIDNIPALKLYEKLGFTIVGKKNMYDNEYYICELNVKNPE